MNIGSTFDDGLVKKEKCVDGMNYKLSLIKSKSPAEFNYSDKIFERNRLGQ